MELDERTFIAGVFFAVIILTAMLSLFLLGLTNAVPTERIVYVNQTIAVEKIIRIEANYTIIPTEWENKNYGMEKNIR